MAIELISTITTKNNSSFAIALSNEIKGGVHSKNSIKERDEISLDRLQEGMLCYVGGNIKKYYQWTNGKWENFSSGGADSDILIYRVDTYNDMISLDKSVIKNGFLCHVKNDNNGCYLYYYHNNEWTTLTSNGQVWIGTTPPPNKKYLWVDTRHLVSGDDITMDNPPTFIDTQLIQYLKEQIGNFNTRIKQLERIIKYGVSIGGGNNGGDSTGGDDSQLQGTYFTDEEGNYFISEDGNFFITEDSYIDSISPGQSGSNNNNNNNNNNTGGGTIIFPDLEGEIEDDTIYAVKGGRITTSIEHQELLQYTISQVTIFNETEIEVTLVINGGEEIPIQPDESLSLGDIDIFSIIVLEKGSTIKYIGI